jgi:ankyrin repeat protein
LADDKVLYRAVQHGQLAIVEWVLTSGVKPDAESVHAAAKNGHSQIVEKLLATGVLTGATVEQAFTIAVTNGHVNVVKVLIPLVTPNVVYKASARVRHLDMAQYFVGGTPSTPEELQFRAKVAESILNTAQYEGRANIITFLIKAGLVVDTATKGVMRTACSKGFVDVVAALLEHGVTVDDRDLFLAATYPDLIKLFTPKAFEEIVPILVKDQRITALIQVGLTHTGLQLALTAGARYGYVGDLLAVLDTVTVDVAGAALVEASANGSTQIVELLMNRGVSSETRRQALNVAGNADVIRLLLTIQNGDSINLHDALMCAVRTGRKSNVELLASVVDAAEARAALMLALVRDDKEIVQILKNAGASL